MRFRDRIRCIVICTARNQEFTLLIMLVFTADDFFTADEVSALSEPLLGVAAVLISAFTKFDEYSVCIAIITKLLIMFIN